MSAITVLAILTMAGSVIIAHMATGDAAAINASGTLRMQAYRIATHMARPGGDTWHQLQSDVARFEGTLYGHDVVRDIPESTTNPVRSRYAEVQRLWNEEMRPAIESFRTDPTAARRRYTQAVSSFVDHVDDLVAGLQHQAERKVQFLRVVQGSALFITLGLVFFAMYKLLIDVTPPFRDLMYVVDEARRGNFEARTSYRAADELGMLSRTFNAMAANISRMYGDLERRVAEKTAALRQSNQALQLLYDTSRQLSAERRDLEHYRSVLTEVEQTLEVGTITLCLSNPGSDRAYTRLSTAGSNRPSFCRAPECAQCLGRHPPGETRAISDGLISVPVADAERRYGALLVAHDPGRVPSAWQLRLCEAVGEHIATSISLERHAEHQHRLALMDERAVIARELHDSLAQALSYLKIQVSRLQAEFDSENPDRQRLLDVTGELREGLNDAYRQLRELLNTFRLTMTDAGLHKALQRSVEEFAAQGNLDVQLRFRLEHVPLTPNEEIHLLQTVREALTNVVRHANASRAWVILASREDGAVAVEIGDDGVGIPTNWARANHYGIKIMEERVGGLGGTLRLERPPGGGTVVRIAFMPQQSHAPWRDAEPR